MLRFSLVLALLVGCTGDSGVIEINNPPSVTIISPIEGAVFNEGEVITFEAMVQDDKQDPADLTITWLSDLLSEPLKGGALPDGDGYLQFSTTSLPNGTQTIMLQAVDSEAEPGDDVVTISVKDLEDAPSISVVQPADGQSGIEGEAFEFTIQVDDAQDLPEDLLVSFESDIEGVFCEPVPDELGKAACEYTLTPVLHELIFTVTDTEEFSASEVVYFTVVSGDTIDDDGDGWTEEQGDCDDNNNNINPGATEVENGLDDDCDGDTDEGTNAFDDDGDGYTENENDCDDSDPDINPGATEVCGDSVDDNCDGSLEAEDAIGCTTYYRDYDGDGYGSTTDSQCLCSADGYYTSTNALDCYDYNGDVNPAQSGYYTTARGDGSFDYDCDSVETQYWTSSGGCGSWPGCSSTSGWASGVASCGSSSNYVTSCDLDWFSCSENTSNYTQQCR